MKNPFRTVNGPNGSLVVSDSPFLHEWMESDIDLDAIKAQIIAAETPAPVDAEAKPKTAKAKAKAAAEEKAKTAEETPATEPETAEAKFPEFDLKLAGDGKGCEYGFPTINLVCVTNKRFVPRCIDIAGMKFHPINVQRSGKNTVETAILYAGEA